MRNSTNIHYPEKELRGSDGFRRENFHFPHKKKFSNINMRPVKTMKFSKKKKKINLRTNFMDVNISPDFFVIPAPLGSDCFLKN